MVARIAPSPLSDTVAIGDAYAHARGTAGAHNPPAGTSTSTPDAAANASAHPLGNLPPPAPPPGEAFAAAVIAGQLPPVPITPEDLRQRLGAAWQPPDSPLRLMDRSA